MIAIASLLAFKCWLDSKDSAGLMVRLGRWRVVMTTLRQVECGEDSKCKALQKRRAFPPVEVLEGH